MYTHEQFRLQCEFVITKCYEKELHNRQNLERDEQHLLMMLSNSYHHSHHKELKLIEENVNYYRHIQIYKYLINIVQHVERNLHVILNWAHDPFQMSKKLTKQIGTIQYAGHNIHHFGELHSLGKMFKEYFGMNIDQFEVCWQMIELCNDLEAMKNLYLSHFCKHYGLMAVTIHNNGHYFTELYRTYDFYIADENYAQSPTYIPPPGAQPYNNPTYPQQSYQQYPTQPYGQQATASLGNYPPPQPYNNPPPQPYNNAPPQPYNNPPGNTPYAPPYQQPYSQGYNTQQPYQQPQQPYTPPMNQPNTPSYGQQPYAPPPQGQQPPPYGQPYQQPGQQYPNQGQQPYPSQQPYPQNQPQNTQYQQNTQQPPQQPSYPPMPPTNQQPSQLPTPQQYQQQPNPQYPQQQSKINQYIDLPPPKPYP